MDIITSSLETSICIFWTELFTASSALYRVLPSLQNCKIIKENERFRSLYYQIVLGDPSRSKQCLAFHWNGTHLSFCLFKIFHYFFLTQDISKKRIWICKLACIWELGMTLWILPTEIQVSFLPSRSRIFPFTWLM